MRSKIIGQVLLRALIATARARRRLVPGERPREELVARKVPGRSFVDVGCMWNIHGGIAFAAEDAGASRVTGLDVMAATPEYEAEHARRGSSMRFVHGDLHDPATRAEVGEHDVVWCSGLIYHAPHPLLSIEALRELTTDTLILASETMPEVPGVPQACVFYPGLSERARLTHASARPGEHTGLTTPFEPERGYANWFWGISHSAMKAMIECSGFEVVEEYGNPFHATMVAKRV
jgi:methyltransferase family protein